MDKDISGQKEMIEQSIVEKLLRQIDLKAMTIEESMQIVNYCIEKIKPLNTHEELEVFLTALSSQWPVFSDILILENAKKEEANKDVAVDKIINLTKNGQLDEALNVAKSATNN